MFTSTPPRVFLSYASVNHPAALALADALMRAVTIPACEARAMVPSLERARALAAPLG